MKTLLEKVNDLNEKIIQGKAMEAFEKYYHEDVIMQEGDADPTIGKTSNRRREEEFFGAITEFREAKVQHIAIGQDVSMVEWHFDYTHKDWGIKNYTQIAVQSWKDGQIIKEKFYSAS